MRGFSIEEVKRLLSYYTPIPHKPVVIDEMYVNNYHSGKIHTLKQWELLLYYTIKVRYNTKEAETYELSLFGVLLVMLILRNHDMGKLKHGLYYKEESFETYYDKIALNYKNNLPLIFRKWYLLKRILKIFAAYNFDIVLDKETRDNAMKSLSVISDILHPNQPQQVSITSGNKEIYEAAKSIEEISYRQLGEIQVKGMEESLNFVESLIHNFLSDKPFKKLVALLGRKLKAVFQLIDEITTLLDPLAFDPKSFTENIGKGQEFVDVERLRRLYDIDTVEKPSANQISFQYYLNLNNEDHFEVIIL